MGISGCVKSFGLTYVTRRIAYGKVLGVEFLDKNIQSCTIQIVIVGILLSAVDRRSEYRPVSAFSDKADVFVFIDRCPGVDIFIIYTVAYEYDSARTLRYGIDGFLHRGEIAAAVLCYGTECAGRIAILVVIAFVIVGVIVSNIPHIGNRIFPGIFGLCGRNRFSEYLYLVYFYGLLLSVRIDSRIEGGISIGIGLECRRSGVSVPDAPT